MEVLCIKERPEWKNIHSGRIYYAVNTPLFFVINGNKIPKNEFYTYFQKVVKPEKFKK